MITSLRPSRREERKLDLDLVKASAIFRFAGRGFVGKGLCLVLLFYGVLHSFATIITFDELSVSGGIPVPNPYNGLTWTNFYPASTNSFSGPNGFTNACISGTNFAFNGSGAPASISSGLFNLNGGYFAAGWRDNLQLQVAGFLRGSLLYSNTYTLSATSGTMLTFNYQGVDTVVFSASGGTQDPGYSSDGTFFGVDNLDVTVVAPVFSQQPAIHVDPSTFDVTLSASVLGSVPIYYQWQFDGTNIDNATNSSFVLSNLQASNDGYYDLIASNAYGAVTSSNVILDANSLSAIVAWGNNVTGVTNVPSGLSDAKAIASGDAHMLALKSDGTVVAWGDNTSGPTNVPSGLQNVSSIAAGGGVSLAVLTNGLVVAWGYNAEGQTNVPSTLSNVVAVATGGLHCLALKSDGSIVGWGYNAYGQTTIPAGPSNFVSVACGATHSMALRDDGTVVAWGYNPYHETNVPVGLSNVVAIAASIYDSVALKVDGTVVAWGNDCCNQTNVPVGLSNVVSIASGEDFNLALKQDGTVVGWGDNSYGQSSVPGGLSNIVALAAGMYDSEILLHGLLPVIIQQPLSRTVFSGSTVSFYAGAVGNSPLNLQWQLNGTNVVGATNLYLMLTNVQPAAAGYYTLVASNPGTGMAVSSNAVLSILTSPPIILNQPSNTLAFSGGSATLAASVTGSLPVTYQWQLNGTNINGATNATLSLSNLQWSSEGIYTLVVSNQYGSAVSSNATLTMPRSRVVAWGSNSFGQTNVPQAFFNVRTVAAGQNQNLVIKSDGTVGAWGDNTYGQTNVPAGLSNVIAIGGGQVYSEALRSDGTVVVWGNTTLSNVPPNVTNVTGISGGLAHIVAVRSDTTVVAWGANSYGQTNVPVGLSNVTMASAGGYHTLALKKNGTVVSWGNNSNGQTNVPSGLSAVASVAAGGYHSLALRSNGTVIAWGNNQYGQTNVPQGLSNVVAIAAGTSHSLALKSDGTMLSWGINTSGLTNFPMGLSNVVAIAGGNLHSLALLEDGPPVVVSQPLNQAAYSGTAVTLGAFALGAQPMSYQWLFNGTNLNAATNAALVLTGVSTNPAGLYSLSVSNIYGTTTSSNAALTVLTAPPSFTLQPASQTVLLNSNAVLVSSATGSQPINYQWQFNGTNLPNATNASLTITKAQVANQGTYAVVASNSFGITNSSNAFLTVIDLALALNITNVVWTTSASPAWFPETNVSHDGFAAASSGSVGYTSQSFLQTTVVGPGTLSFWWQATSSPLGIGSLNLAIDTTNRASVSTGAGWQQQVFYLTAGTHTLRWAFSWYTQGPYTMNGWLDQVSYTAGPTPALITTGPSDQTVPAGTNVSFTAIGGGTPPLSYQWSFNGTNIAGATGASLALNNVQAADAGLYTISISNAYGFTNASATLTVNPSSPWISVQPTGQKAVLGGNCAFSGVGLGSQPLSYQWQFNGSNLVGATSSQLLLAAVSSNSAGVYSLVVSNAYGASVSSNAALTLVSSSLVGWGDNTFGQTSIPASLSNVTAFAGGWDYSVAADANGIVTNWGFTETPFSPVPSGVTALAAGASHMVALRSDGTVVAAGASVPPGLGNVVAIAAGNGFSLALKNDGTVFAWGNATPVVTNAPAELSNVVAIACGLNHALALKSDGTVTAWGQNFAGSTDVPLGLTDVAAVSAGWYDSLAIKQDGTVVAWGYGGWGVTNIPSGLTNVVAVAGGNMQSIALKSDGTVVAWGNNSYGQTNIPFVVTNVAAISSGDAHCLALLKQPSLSILRQPYSQTILNRMQAVFSVGAVGTGPLGYQWRFNGTNISGANGSMLSLPDVDATNAGAYDVVVTNTFGAVTSSVATLTVQMLRPLIQAPGSGGPFGSGIFGFNISGPNGLVVVVEASTNLINWIPIQTNAVVNGQIRFVDTQAWLFPQRYYRAFFLYASFGQPLLQSSFSSGISSSSPFGFDLSGRPGQVVVIQASTNLVNWTPILTNTMQTGYYFFTDPLSASFQYRFYRAQAP